MVGSGEVSIFQKSFSKRKDACPNFNFLPGFQFRFRDAGAGEAAISAAALVLPFDEESQQAAAAYVGLEEHARAAGAETDLLGAAVEVNALHAAPNSDGLGKVSGMHTIVLVDNGASGVAATELPAAPITDGLGIFLSCTVRRIYLMPSGCSTSGVMVELPVSGGTLAALLSVSLKTWYFVTLMIIHCTIPSMHVHILVLMVVGRGLGFVLGILHVYLCRLFYVFLVLMMMWSCNCMCMSGCAAEFTPGSWSLSPGRNKVFEKRFWGQGLAF